MTGKLYLSEFSAVSPNFSLIFNVLQDLWALSIFIAGQSSPTPPLKMFRLFHSLLSLSHSASLSSPLTSALSATLSSATSLRRYTPFFPLSLSPPFSGPLFLASSLYSTFSPFIPRPFTVFPSQHLPAPLSVLTSTIFQPGLFLSL